MRLIAPIAVLVTSLVLAAPAMAGDNGEGLLGETDDKGEVRVKIRASTVESVDASFRRTVKTAEADTEVYEASLTFEVAK